MTLAKRQKSGFVMHCSPRQQPTGQEEEEHETTAVAILLVCRFCSDEGAAEVRNDGMRKSNKAKVAKTGTRFRILPGSSVTRRVVKSQTALIAVFKNVSK